MFCLERVAKVQPCEYATLEGFEAFLEALGDVVLSLDSLDTFLESSFIDFPRHMLTTFNSDEAVEKRASQGFWNLVIHTGDGRRDEISNTLGELA